MLVRHSVHVVGKYIYWNEVGSSKFVFQLLDDPIYFVVGPIFSFPPMNGTNAFGIVIDPSAFW